MVRRKESKGATMSSEPISLIKHKGSCEPLNLLSEPNIIIKNHLWWFLYLGSNIRFISLYIGGLNLEPFLVFLEDSEHE